MAAVIVCKKPGGRILVSAMPDAPPEYEQDAVEAASIEEAGRMVVDVLGAEQTGEEQPAATGEEPAAAPEGAEGMPMDSREDQMAAGFTRAKGGY